VVRSADGRTMTKKKKLPNGQTVFAVMFETDEGGRGLHSLCWRELDANTTARAIIGTPTPRGKITLADYEAHVIDGFLT